MHHLCTTQNQVHTSVSNYDDASASRKHKTEPDVLPELTKAGPLGHTVKGVTARYAHVPDRALVSAADAVAARIAAMLRGEAEAPANVVAFRALAASGSGATRSRS